MGKVAFVVFALFMLGGALKLNAVLKAPAEDDSRKILLDIRGAVFRDAHPRVYHSHRFDPDKCDFSAKCDGVESAAMKMKKDASDKRELEDAKAKAEADVKTGYPMSLDDYTFENWVSVCGFALGDERLSALRQQRKTKGK